MNKQQYSWSGIMLLAFGAYLLYPRGDWCNAMILSEVGMTNCFIHRYAYTIPGLIMGWLGMMCTVLSFLEKEK